MTNWTWSQISNGFSRFCSQCFKGDFLCLVNGGSFDRLELFHEFSFQRLVVGFCPGSMLFEWLSDGNLKVEASTADLAGDLGAREGLQLGEVFVEQCLAGLETLRVTRSSRWARRVLRKGMGGIDDNTKMGIKRNSKGIDEWKLLISIGKDENHHNWNVQHFVLAIDLHPSKTQHNHRDMISFIQHNQQCIRHKIDAPCIAIHGRHFRRRYQCRQSLLEAWNSMTTSMKMG